MIVTIIARLIAALNANRRPGEVAAGIAMGVLLALMPTGNLLWVLLLILSAFLRINLGIEIVTILVFSPLSPLADPLLHRLGLAILTNPNLESFFASLYQLPLLPFTRFNNTVVLGSFIAGIVLWLPVFFLGRVLVGVYRTKIHPAIANSKIVKAFEKVPIVSKITGLVRKFSRIYGAVA